MADGIHQTMTNDEAFRILRAARDRPVEGEPPIVTASRQVVRDHEIDPSDRTIRVFGGRDEARLVSAIGRIDPASPSAAEVEGRLKADVAVQRMAAQRDREIGSRLPHAGFEKRDRDALHGDVSKLAAEKSHFGVGALAMGKFDRAHPDLRAWTQDSVAFAGREAAARGPRGVGDRMASIGAFRASALSAQAAEAAGAGGRGGPVSSKGPLNGIAAVAAMAASRASNGR